MSTTNVLIPSTRALFYALDEKSSSSSSSFILEKVSSTIPFLTEGLKAYRKSNKESRDKIQSGSIDVGNNKKVTVGVDMQNISMELAKLFDLDEIITYVMLRRSLEEKEIKERPKELTKELIEIVSTYYHRERLALLKCIAVLGTRKAYYVSKSDNDNDDEKESDDGDDEEFNAKLSEKLEEMITNGLENNIVTYLCESLLANDEGKGLLSSFLSSSVGSNERALTSQNPTSSAIVQNNLNKKPQENALLLRYGEEYVRLSSCIESVEEIKASLDVLFSLYYGVKACESSLFLKLIKSFEQNVFSKIPHKLNQIISLAPDLKEQTETISMTDLRSRCAITLIVSIDLERMVNIFSDNSKSGSYDKDKAHHLIESASQLTQALSQMTDTLESDAFKLSWAAFLSLAKSLINNGVDRRDGGKREIATMDSFLNSTNVARGIDSLKRLAMNSTLTFDASDPSAVPRRSVMKNVFSATIAGFDILPIHSLFKNQLDLILSCFDEIMNGQRELCEQFWEGSNESGQEAPLLALVEGCRERFPAEAAPLLRVLKSLSAGPKSAECSLAYLTKLPAVALPYPDRDVAKFAIKQADKRSRIDQNNGNILGNVVCVAPIASSKVPGACIPSNCKGISIPSATTGGTNLIVWSEPADGLYITLSRIGNLSSVSRRRSVKLTSDDRAELHAALSFIATALENAPSFASPLLKCDLRAAASEIGGTPGDVLSALALSLRVEYSDENFGFSIQAKALEALRPLAAAAPRRAASVVLNTPFFLEDEKTTSSSTTGVTISQCLQFEESRGKHECIKALCSLSETLLLAGECGDESQSLFQRSVLFALLRFDSFRYLERSDKWMLHQCASKALHAALLTSKLDYFQDNPSTSLGGGDGQSFSTRTCLFLTNDEQTLAGAFSPLRFDAKFLQRAYESGSSRRAKEIVALEDAIACVLKLLPALSSVFENSSNVIGGMFSRSIAKALFIEAPPPERGPPMVQAIASYASYPYASDCCSLAIPALIPLCTSAPPSAPLSAAFAGAPAESTCIKLRDRIKLALKDVLIDSETASHAISLLASASANQPPFADAMIYGPNYAQEMINIGNALQSEDGSETDKETDNKSALTNAQPPSSALATIIDTVASVNYTAAYDELWLALDQILEVDQIKYTAAFSFALAIFWKSRVQLPSPVDGLASEPKVFQKLVSIIERASDTFSKRLGENDDDVECAHALSASASSIGILSSEALVALTIPVGRSKHLREALNHFCSRNEGLLRSIKLAVVSAEDKTNTAFMKMDIFVAGLRAIMLTAAGELATAQAGGESVCFASATLESGAQSLARLLLEQSSAREVLAREGQASAARLLTDVALAATAKFETMFAENNNRFAETKHASSRVNDLLHHASTNNCERFIFVDAPIGLGGASVYGDSYLYDSEWIQSACGVFNTDDGRWGAPETRLASLARKVAACARDASKVASLCDAKITSIENLTEFLKSSGMLETFIAKHIVGPELNALDAEQLKAIDERKKLVKQNLLSPKFEKIGLSLTTKTMVVKNAPSVLDDVIALIQPSILEKFSNESRRSAVNLVANELISAIQNRRSESPRQVALIVALCELLEISSRLWSSSSRKNSSANESEIDYEVLQNVARASCLFLSSKVCVLDHDAYASACAAFERSLSCWSKEANAEDAAKAIDIGNLASQAIQDIRTLALSSNTSVKSSVCALRLITKLFSNGGSFASPSMLIAGGGDIVSSSLTELPFIPDLVGLSRMGYARLSSLRASIRSNASGDNEIEIDCSSSEFDELARFTPTDVIFSALYCMLEFAKTSEGAYALIKTGAYDRVYEITAELKNECNNFEDAPGDEDVLKLSALHLAIQISTELAKTSSSFSDEYSCSKLAAFACLIERYVEKSLKPSSISLNSLRKANVCCALIAAMSNDERLKFGWQARSPNGQARIRDGASIFLRWFAAPPINSGSASHNCCLPRNESEEARALQQSETGLSSCWFGVLNRGSRVLTSLRTMASLSPMSPIIITNSSALITASNPSSSAITPNSALFTSSTSNNNNKTPTTPTLISNQGGQALGTPLGRKRPNDQNSPTTPDGLMRLKSPSPINALNVSNERTNLHSEILALELHDVALHCATFLSTFNGSVIAHEVSSSIVDQCEVLLEELQVLSTKSSASSETKAGIKIRKTLTSLKNISLASITKMM